MYNPSLGEEIWCEIYDEYESDIFHGNVVAITDYYTVDGEFDIFPNDQETVSVREQDIYKTKNELLEKLIADSIREIEHFERRIKLLQNEVCLLQSEIDNE